MTDSTYCDEHRVAHCPGCHQTHGDQIAGIRAVREAEADARRQNESRRARVLAHPDIAQALIEPPLRHSSPEMWNGAIPPAMVPTKLGWKPNRSPIRAALILICEAVVEAEKRGAA